MDWGVEVLQFPPEKDQTDLELAILEVLRRGFNEIVLTCAIGGRLDHTLGNLALLALPDLRDCHTYISHGNTAIYLINDHIDLPSYPGNLISLLPWGEVVQGSLPLVCIMRSTMPRSTPGKRLVSAMWQQATR